jgi:hypothetical protein
MRRPQLGAWTRGVLTGTLVGLFLVPGTLVVGSARAAEPAGELSFDPPTGLDSYSLSVVSSGVCTDSRATNLQLRVSGAGFPDNTNVTPNLNKAVYPIDPRTGGYDVSLQDTMQAFASRQSPPAVLSGRYTFTLICRRPFGETSFGSYSGTLTFATPTHYQAVGAASTVVPPTPSVTKTPGPTATSSVAPPKRTRTTSVPAGWKTAKPTSRPAPATAPRTPAHSALPATPGAGQSGGAEPSTATTPTRAEPSVQATATTSVAAEPPVAGTTSPRATSTSSSSAAAVVSSPVQHRVKADVAAVLVAATLAAVAVLGLILRRRRLSHLRGPHV